jgi:flagellar motility protein MotE (MotC chaperone)
VNRLLGKVPYLNGGLFLRHQIEQQHGKDIQVADAAFARLFGFFEQYHWHLDERPLRRDDEINPDVLGYIFEKYINQKQMGAYYTKEDITGYISQNTVIPFLFDTARQKCKIAFEGNQSLWRLLQLDPDRYIYEPVKRGVIDEKGHIIPESALPEFVQRGMHEPKARMFDKRYNLGAADLRDTAGTKLTLPTETWREYVERRKRCLDLRQRLANGEIQSINDLITYNLNIRQFAQDVIENSEGPELLRAFYRAIEKVTVLDPTCGSGAFLFAALNILEPLYEACLDRMEVFVDELTRSGAKHRPEKFSDFKKILERVASHPNRRYFILKSIILNNLYGVDIMEEAVEICKLRLFLKLVAQVEKVEQIEPLPDIDFNIRAGNTLIGYASIEDLRKSMEGDWVRQQSLPTIEENAEIADRAFQKFHEMQTEHGMEAKDFAEAKEELRRRLKTLEDELNRYLATEYGVDASKRVPYAKWLATHKPFHWFIEFYRIMKSGGFDAIIGNPPYVVYSEDKVGYRVEPQEYATLPTKNLYAFVFERSLDLVKPRAPVGLIVQLTVLSSERLPHLQDLLFSRGGLIVLPFPRRPESIFEGVEMPVAILVSMPTVSVPYSTCRVMRFYTEERPHALAMARLTGHSIRLDGHRIAKLSLPLEMDIYAKICSHRLLLESLTRKESRWILYYQEACRYWVKACEGLPFFKRNGVKMAPPHGRTVCFESEQGADFAVCLANSTLFYWFYSVFSDCEHINDGLIRGFRIPEDWERTDWARLSRRLSTSIQDNSVRKTIATKQGHTIEYAEINALNSKSIIDEIDRVLAKHYGFTDEELDFIINYDIKYRMGQDTESDDEK